MPEISCTARKCAYNEDGFCDRDNVKIDLDGDDRTEGCTCCDSFEGNCDCKDCSCQNFAGENALVECLAETCIYNQNHECYADFISVEGHNAHSCTDTFCDTFRTAR